jgi:hypothetical protein
VLDLPYILRRAGQMLRGHGVLWGLGCLAQLGTVGVSAGLGSRGLWQQATREMGPAAERLFGRFAGSPALPIAAALLGLLVAAGLFLVAVLAQAALVDQLRTAEECGEVRWRAAWQGGRKHVGSVLVLRLGAALPPLLITVVGALPLIIGRILAEAPPRLLRADAAQFLLRSAGLLLCLLPALGLATLVAIPLHALFRLAVCGCVLEHRSVRDAVRHALATLRRHTGSVLLVWLVELGATLLAIIAVGLPLGVLALAGDLAVAVVRMFSAIAALLLAAAGGVLARAVVVACDGLLETFGAILWTLAYRDLGGLGLTGAEEG